jgi:thiol-disulfide isomerase/thioredoxin
MKYLFFVLVFLYTTFGHTQEIIIGNTNVKSLEQDPYKSWFLDGYKSFQPNQGIIEELSEYFKKEEYQIDVYFGTWCSDSQREVPHLIKILKEAEFNLQNLRLIGVDEDKIVPDVSEAKRKELDITNVPTMIIYKDGKELNRFVEYAQETLEEDLLKIFSGQPYKHSYQF